MKTTLRLEEIAMLFLGVYGFSLLHFSWWWFLILFLSPDIGMIGYLFNAKIGAFLYNIFHHKGIAIVFYLSGHYFRQEILTLIGVILFAHASFDRVLGYGLKYEKGFTFTHLGNMITKN